MGIKQTLLHAPIVAASLDKNFVLKKAIGHTSTIQWGNCSFSSTATIQCATLPVPLDYNDTASGATLNLELIKVPVATNVTSKGSILFNFGGPGYEAVQSLASLATLLSAMTGGQHDLIAFDPRGTGNTLTYSCFENDTDREIATYKFPLSVGLDEVTVGKNFANGKAIGNICGEKAKDFGTLVGTAYVARDMMQIVDALGGDRLLRFWGFSYGTVLGATVAAMFPDRMERMILDGVVNVPNYYHRYGVDIDQLLSVDSAFSSVMADCITAGDKCALSKYNSTGLDLETTLMTMADELKAAPIALNDTVISYDLVIGMIYTGLKYPAYLPNVTIALADLLNRENLDQVTALAGSISGSISIGTEGLYGILCSDKFPRDTDASATLFDVKYMGQTSATFAPIVAPLIPLCAQWPFEAKERYSGDFKVKTRNPILFVGNTWDPATAYESAETMSGLFEGSVMWRQNGYGHCTISQVCLCTWKIVSEYFINATLPEKGTICEVDEALFQ